MAKRSINRAISVNQLLSTNFKTMKFEGEFKESFGTPQIARSWLIWGDSGNGKTRFTLRLAKYLTQFGKVAYNSLEEGASLSFKRAIQETGMVSVAKKFIILKGESITELKERLVKQKSPNIIIVDSVQYTDLDKRSYKALLNEFPTKLFIFISHAEGKDPTGATAKAIKYDSDIKIRVEGYKAFARSRFGGDKPFIIWEKGAEEYWKNKN
ncbi:MAG: hypothetical protein HYR91_13425 [Flavobacteriia bacterium]|nr:hypothetical protein [Flavobacteriia bacterium]